MRSQQRVTVSIGIYLWRILTTCIFLDYETFANALRSIDKNPAVAVTIWQGELSPPRPLASRFDSSSNSDWQMVLRWNRRESPTQ